MRDHAPESYHDKLFKTALNNLLKSKKYNTASLVEKHKLLVMECERLYWKDRKVRCK
jgi:hypothetical protein